MRKIYLLLLTVCFAAMANGQLTGTKNIPGDYADLTAAITDLNTQGVGAGGVVFNLIAANPQTAPAGGYVIGGAGSLVLTTSSAANTITFQGNGNSVTSSTALTAGALNDGIFKLIGADWVTISGFTLLEDAANTTTTAASNNMTEWGIALLYVTTTDGAQNNTVSGNTIDLNRTYQNTFGIYANATHSATAVTTSATATGAAGGNSGLKIYGNTITDVNIGIVVVGPTAAADNNDGVEIGGSAPNANTITNFGTTGTFSSYANVSGTVNGILIRNSKNFIVSNNTVASSVGGVTAGTLNGIQVPAFSNAPTGTFSNSINSNSISLQSGVIGGAMNGINVGGTSASTTSTININNNNFHTFGHTVAGTASITFITQAGTHQFANINNNTFTNITVNTTGSVTFISNSWTNSSATGIKNVNNNSIVTAFSKTGAGGTITLFTDNGSDVAGAINNSNNNNFSNISVTGATTIAGWSNTNGGTPTKSVTGNTFSNWTGGTSAITGLAVSFSGNSTVSGNIVSNISSAGAITGITSGSGTLENFTQNTVHTLTSTGASAVTGMSNTGGTTKNFIKNKIYNLEANNASGTVNGILVSSGTTVTLHNNIIGDLRTPSANAAIPLAGLNITGGTTVNAYYNTVYLNTSSSGALFGSSAISASTTPALTLRNNIFVNTSTPAGATGFTSAYRRSSTTLTTYAAASNNNLFYAGTPSATNLIFYHGATGADQDQTLAAYKARVTPRDANSVTENPPFLSTTGSSANFLHIDPSIATQVESGAATVAGITDDFDGNVRNVTTPDIGADEGTFTLADFSAPLISYTPLTFTCGTGNRTLTASISDASGVPTAGAGLPVLYWRINAGAWTAATGVFVSGSNYDFTFGSGVVTGDVVQYYIVAQDNAGTPNVGAFPSAGAAGFTINPPAAATAPTTPSSYSINNTLSGTYTVGAAGTYTTLTAAINAYNTNCLGGPVVFSLTDASYTSPSETFPLIINANPDASSTNTLTIRPATGVTATISGANTTTLIKLNGADYVIFDGSNNGTNSRDLTITNTSTGAVIWIGTDATAGATNNIIKNLNMVGPGAFGGQGIIGGSGATFGNAAENGRPNSNNTIQNTTAKGVQNAVFVIGDAVTLDQNWVITQNTFGSTVTAEKLSFRGIAVQNSQNFSITQNTITGVSSSTSSSSTMTGILVGATLNGGTISRNQIRDIKQNNTTGWGSNGIYLNTASTAANVTVVNNFISDIASQGFNAVTQADNGYGIMVNAGGGFTIHYNTVNMATNQVTATGLPAAINIAVGVTTASSIDLRNNIFSIPATVGTNRYAIYSAAPNTVFSNINNNDYYSSGANLGFIGSDRATLADIITGFGGNAASQNALPTFISATDLHLVTPDANNFNYLESKGVVVATDIDIDSQDRPNGTAPDIGADEFVGAAPSCNVPTAVSIGSISTTSASVSFTCTGCTGTYIVEYGAPGFVPGTGGSAGGGTIVTGAASPIAISPLTAATTYDVYVRQDCGAGSYSNNSTVVTFTTLCNTISLPYTENFDAVTPPAVPNCSLVENVNGSTTWATAALNPNSAPNSLTYSYNSTLPGDDWWYTPGFNLTGGTSYRLTFSYRARSASFPEALEVKYGNGQNAGAMTSSAIFSNTNITNTTYSQANIDFTPGSSGVYYIGFHNISLADQFDLHVDDIGLDVTPACPAPAQPTMSAITSNSAIATWAGAASYILEYGPTGYTPGTGATAGAGGTLIDPAVSPQSITGLSGTTTYDLYVRQVCAGPSWSANSLVRTFTTLAAPPPNDEASGAILLTVGAGCTGATYTNVAATASANEPYPSCSGTKQSPVWFSFVAPASGAVRVSTDVGSGPTFTDSKLGLFSGTDLIGYTDFQIISCDDDGGSVVGSGFLSVVYATGLTPGTTYYIAADRYSSFTTNGTFCIAVDELNNSHLSTVTTCTTGQTPVSNSNTTYAGWAPLMDNSSRLIALVRNPAGGDVSLYSIAQNINAAAVRSASGVYYLDRNYRINNSSATNVDVQFFYLNSELTALALANPSTTAANLGASRQAGTVCQNDYSPVNGTPTFIAQTGNGVSTDGLVRWIAVTTPSFSNFYLQSSVGGTLPTGLLTFSGAKEGSVNKLRWTTSSEQNNSGFEVQRSTDGITFTAIGFVNSQAMGGNSSDALNYIFIDNNPVGDKQYYRLRQVDLDNRSKLSNIVMIKGNKPVTLAIGGLFPNPANSQINVILDAPVRDKVTLVVMDATGKTVIQQVVNVETGSNTIPVNISTLTNGTYLVKLVCNSNCESAVAKFVKQ